MTDLNLRLYLYLCLLVTQTVFRQLLPALLFSSLGRRLLSFTLKQFLAGQGIHVGALSLRKGDIPCQVKQPSSSFELRTSKSTPKLSAVIMIWEHDHGLMRLENVAHTGFALHVAEKL